MTDSIDVKKLDLCARLDVVLRTSITDSVRSSALSNQRFKLHFDQHYFAILPRIYVPPQLLRFAADPIRGS